MESYGPGGMLTMIDSVIGFARETRTGVRTVVVCIVMSVLVAMLSHFVFTPWHFVSRDVEEPSRSIIPRVAVGQ